MTSLVATDASARIRERKLTLVAADLAGFTRSPARYEALELAALLDDFYRRASTTLRAPGGRVVKFMGDACFAVIPRGALRTTRSTRRSRSSRTSSARAARGWGYRSAPTCTSPCRRGESDPETPPLLSD